MVPEPVRLYNPNSADRVAVVSVEPSGGSPMTYLIRVGRGANRFRLTKGATYGPHREEDLTKFVADAVAALKGEGYQRSGLPAMLEMLRDRDAAVRARAAARLGWRRDPDAVQPLLDLLPNAVDELCAILDALGAIGDDRAVTVLRDQAQRKFLSRRRSAVEALRNLGDMPGLSDAEKLACDRLPDTVRKALVALPDHPSSDEQVQPLVAVILGLDSPQRGLALDTLYELATPATVRAVAVILRQTRFDRPHAWRYSKSVFKRAMLRHDYKTVGLLSHDVEAQARKTTGTTATVKSGYDGVDRPTSIFRHKTQLFMRRLAWRYLRRLAKWMPEAYPYAAAEALAHYTPTDAEPAQGYHGPYASCYVFHRILFDNSDRFQFDGRRLKFRFVSLRKTDIPSKLREEAYPELWDAEPRAYLRVLGSAKVPEAHVFAVRALSVERVRMAVLETASHEEVIALLQAPYEPTVELGLTELDRRFDPARPDWSLIAAVLPDGRKLVREVAQRWVKLTAPLWTQDAERIVTFVETAHISLRPLVLNLARPALTADKKLRQQAALRVLVRLRQPEATPGAHDGLAELARLALLDELAQVLNTAEIVDLITSGSPAAQSVAGDLLGRRTEAFAELGLERLVALAQHEVAAVRTAAHNLLRAGIELLQEDASPLFALVESEWADTRAVAFDLLRNQVGLEALGLDGVTGLLDSNREDVQELGRDLAKKHLASLPIDELVYRLIQHPHPGMRPFTLDLVLNHLPPGAEPLRRLLGFFRSALFDLWPSRAVKRQALELLASRGLLDEEQAKVSAAVLAEVVRFQGRADFERALEALVRLQLAYPSLESPARVRQEGLA